MIRTILSLIVLVFAFGFASCDSFGGSSVVVETNGESNFSFNAPAGWTKVESVGTLVAYRSPELIGGFAPNINILSETIPASVTLDDYMDNTKSMYQKMFTNVTLHSESETSVDGLPTGIIEQSYTMGEIDIRAIQYVYWREGKVYIMTCSAGKDHLTDDLRKTFRSAATSFEAQ